MIRKYNKLLRALKCARLEKRREHVKGKSSCMNKHVICHWVRHDVRKWKVDRTKNRKILEDGYVSEEVRVDRD